MRERHLLGGALLGCGLAYGVAAMADADPTDLIKYRKDVMSALGAHTAAASLIIRGRVDYGPQLIVHARSLALTAPLIKDVFPPDSELGDTNAKPAVWQRPEEFKKHAMTAQEEAAAFLKAAEGGDKAEIRKKFMAMGKACKSCHDDFRKEKKK
jgi:cytochrome c556